VDSRPQSYYRRLAKELQGALRQEVTVPWTESNDSDDWLHLYVELLALASAATEAAFPTFALAGRAGAKSDGPEELRPHRP
jgi:hypothetical protein